MGGNHGDLFQTRQSSKWGDVVNIRNLTGLLVATVMLAGCSPAPSPLSTYVSHDDSGASDGALLAGELILESGCLYVQQSDTRTRYLPLFVEGSASWNGKVLTHADRTYNLGDTIQLIGGVSSLPPKDASVCDDAAPTWVVGDPS